MRLTIKIPKREQYKLFPLASHQRLLSDLHDNHGFTMTKFLRKRENYLHKYDYDLRFEKVIGAIKYEFHLTHDGYLSLDAMKECDDFQRWLSCTGNVVRVPEKFKMEAISSVENVA